MSKFYPVHIGADVLQTFDFDSLAATRLVVVTDQNVWKAQGERLSNILNRSQQTFDVIQLKPSETTKTLQTCEDILQKLAKLNTDRKLVLVAFGGGVVGDITGFVAAIYKRGVRYIHIPTSMLAQIDSSIGGKTGVNLPEGKNLVGSTYFPQVVLIDPTILQTLPSQEFVNGYGEMIKMGTVLDADLFGLLEQLLPTSDPTKLTSAIERTIQITVDVCDADPYENEYRKILNYGHTVGHALERASNYTLPHGTSVLFGMMAEGQIAHQLGHLNAKDLARQNSLIQRMLPETKNSYDKAELIQHMRRDKKSRGGTLYCVLPNRVGGIHKTATQTAWPVTSSDMRLALKSVL